jgi:hypothetical protein
MKRQPQPSAGAENLVHSRTSVNLKNGRIIVNALCIKSRLGTLKTRSLVVKSDGIHPRFDESSYKLTEENDTDAGGPVDVWDLVLASSYIH